MAIDFFTGFEGCGQTSDVQALLYQVHDATRPSYSATGGYANGKCVKMNSSYRAFFQVCTHAKTKVFGFHVRYASTRNYTVTTAYCLVAFGGPNIQIWNTSSGLDIRHGSTQIATGSSFVGPGLTHVEVKVFSNATTGTVQVKINGVLVVDASGLDTDGADITNAYFGTAYNEDTCYDNIFIADDWQGELTSCLLQPTSDTAVEFTPSAGTDNFALVDDAAQDGDTTYVESNTLNHEDLYGYSDIATDAVIKAVSIVTVAKRTDATARSIQHVARQGATDYDLDTFVLADAYPAAANAGQFEVLDAAPDASAWTPTILNAMSFGFKVAV